MKIKEMTNSLEFDIEESRARFLNRIKTFVLKPFILGLFTFAIFFTTILSTKLLAFLFTDNAIFDLNIYDVLFSIIGFFIGFMLKFFLQLRRLLFS